MSLAFSNSWHLGHGQFCLLGIKPTEFTPILRLQQDMARFELCPSHAEKKSSVSRTQSHLSAGQQRLHRSVTNNHSYMEVQLRPRTYTPTAGEQRMTAIPSAWDCPWELAEGLKPFSLASREVG